MTKQALEIVLNLERKEHEKLKAEYQRVAELATQYANTIDRLKKKINCYEAYEAYLNDKPQKNIIRCKDCKHDGLISCPIAYIEKQTLCFVNHDADFYCARGERK